MTANKMRWSVIGVLSFAHLMNDLYQNFIPQLIPFLLTKGFSVAGGASLVAAFTITSSLSQPIFGYLVDQKGQRWLVFAGTLWMSVLLGFTGVLTNYYLLLAVSALAGMGTAAFHPQAAAMVGQESGQRKGFILAMFVAMGNFGSALSPLILLPFFTAFGLKATGWVIFPGILTALLLFKFAPRTAAAPKSSASMAKTLAALKKASSELGKLMVVVAVRSMAQAGIMTLLPLYLLTHQFSITNTSYIMFFTLAAGAIGGVVGGHISDLYGRKPLIVTSLILASCFFYGSLYSSGALSIILLALGGMAVYSTFSVTVAASQEVIPDNKALASGLSLGFSIGIGGLAVTPLGHFADVNGVGTAIQVVFLLPLFAGLIGLTLKKDPAAAKSQAA